MKLSKDRDMFKKTLTAVMSEIYGRTLSAVTWRLWWNILQGLSLSLIHI